MIKVMNGTPSKFMDSMAIYLYGAFIKFIPTSNNYNLYILVVFSMVSLHDLI